MQTEISEASTWAGRNLQVTWRPSAVMPPRYLIRQASGLCFTEYNQIVLVAGADDQWHLPGGKPEGDETIEQTLVREVREEACAVVLQTAYLGAQQVDDPHSPAGLHRYYQTRFWARVQLDPFIPHFETTRRLLIPSSALLATLNWKTKKIAQAMLDAALQITAD